MKKLLLLLSLSCLVLLGNVKAENYTIDNSKVDEMFEKASDIEISSYSEMLQGGASRSAFKVVKGKDPVIAAALNFCLGWLGIHRLYLGTKPLTFVGYIVTLGGLGVISFIDFVMILVENRDISKFVNNPQFFMWLE